MNNYRRYRTIKVLIILLVMLAGILFLFRGAIFQKAVQFGTEHQIVGTNNSKANQSLATQLANTDFQNQSVIIVNNNQPTFSNDDLTEKKGGWVRFANLDSLGRPQSAQALLKKQLMPSKKRERLTIKTPGYHAIRTGNAESDWLYNRSHLIGYQLSGSNNEPKNLITGTRQLNADSRVNAESMVTFENQIADYLKASSNHYVRYQVTPVYRGVELVPRGVWMQGQSLNDDQVKFNVYIFNVQEGWIINYLNGSATRG
ncbi:DNA/RNA non-specific endonuclease [Fructobacillus fructosus]|uniref:Contains Zn-binding and two AraC-type DNA-binding domains (AdaA) n=1 Tax=Fructobacillus fructosus TaxID=1631 RepID=A0ABM9MP38_9LACO|nr:Methylphosphotriester-DNA--protein-cysteine methyltransferase (N-terminal fragment of Ada) [Fructobacillus fructosus]